MSYNRRDFIKMGTAAGILTLFPGLPNIFGEDIRGSDVDMAAVRNGSPAQMFEIGINAMGGFSRFIKKGQIVALKPNTSWNRTPSQGANVSPELVAKVVEMAYKAGAKTVFAFDNTCNEWAPSYRNSGVEQAVKDNGGTMLPAYKEEDYKSVSIPKAKVLKKAQFNKLFLEADVFINIAILKHHSSTRMTSALKNLMGTVYDRRFFHREGLNQCIADIPLVRIPDLTIIDAYNVMLRNGPRGLSEEDLRNDKIQIIGTDLVAIDTACTAIMGIEPSDVGHIIMAEENGIGTTDLEKINIKRITI